jgi:hypothetical protein
MLNLVVIRRRNRIHENRFSENGRGKDDFSEFITWHIPSQVNLE